MPSDLETYLRRIDTNVQDLRCLLDMLELIFGEPSIDLGPVEEDMSYLAHERLEVLDEDARLAAIKIKRE